MSVLKRIGDFLASVGAAWGGIVALAAIAVGIFRWIQRRRHPAPPEEIREVEFSDRIRQGFIERVWAQRIVNGLDRSIQHAAEMQLNVKNAPELVKLSYSQSTSAPGQMLTTEDAFFQAGGQLVVLGPPGSGKTTEALRLMRRLLVAARQNPSAPVPEIFPLASWAKERKPIIEWLADQLRIRHGWPLSEARSLIAHHHVMPVLDGLDEVAGEHRAGCIQEINRFWETHRGGPLVVCSRLAEYEQLPERSQLGGVVTLCTPDIAQIDAYLASARRSWDAVRAQLKEGGNPALRELLSTPLMLSVAVLAYQEHDPAELRVSEDVGTQRDRLWSLYVSTMATRAYDPFRGGLHELTPYSLAQTTRWLGWLAHQMRSTNETELWLHEWVGPPRFRAKVRLALGLVFGLVLGLAVGLSVWLRVSLRAWFGARPALAYRRQQFNKRQFALGLALGSIGGLGNGLVLGLVSGLGSGLALGLGGGLVSGLGNGLLAFGPDRERVAPHSPTQLIRESGWIGLAGGLAGGLVFGLVSGLAEGLGNGLALGLVSGLAVGLASGLSWLVFHYAFRLWLRKHDRGPLRWVSFLDWASAHLLLRTAGASYQWVHLELRDHLARQHQEIAPQEEERATVEVAARRR